MSLLLVFLLCTSSTTALNLAPYFTADMNQHTLSENAEVGSVLYRLQGLDPENSSVYFGLQGSELLSVDRLSGEVVVSSPIDREALASDNELRLTVTLQDEVEPGQGAANLVRVPISVIVLDENDNAPDFVNLPYTSSINEDTPVNTAVFQALEAMDADLVGDVLDVYCDTQADPLACSFFDVRPRMEETDHDMFRGSLVLKRKLDFDRINHFSVPIVVTDGLFFSKTQVVLEVVDVQNRAPIFYSNSGSLTGILNEDDPVGTLVATIKARDGDSGSIARPVIYELLDDHNDTFVIDVDTGELRLDRKLDRELMTTGSVIRLKVKATEMSNGVPLTDSPDAFAIAELTITVKDVNDEPPVFSRRELSVSVSENLPPGTPLANLDMEVWDTDTPPFAQFNLRLIDDTSGGKFSLEPRRATGRTAISLKVNSDGLDYENANERKFLLLIVASDPDEELEHSATATVVVEVRDLNDNSPFFERESYTALVAENAAEGTEVMRVTARDIDSGDFGTKGIRYGIEGVGADLFNIDPISGRISVAACRSDCLDFERTKAYFLTLSATDDNGEGRESVVSLRIKVADANDNAPTFTKKLRASILEGQRRFQPRLLARAKDEDETSVLRYALINDTLNLFNIDVNTGEVVVRDQKSGIRLDDVSEAEKGEHIIKLGVSVTDGVHSASTSIDIITHDINDKQPMFEQSIYNAVVPEDLEVGEVVQVVHADDDDVEGGPNAEVVYRVVKGAFDNFHVDEITGEVRLINELDFDRRTQYNIEIVAVDNGRPQLTGTTVLDVKVTDRNDKRPRVLPATQRAHIAEDALVGTEVLKVAAEDADATMGLTFALVEPMSALDEDGQSVESREFVDWFVINSRTGVITLNKLVDRKLASIVTLGVSVSDQSAQPVQTANGTVVISLVDVNDFAPRFIDHVVGNNKNNNKDNEPVIELTMDEELSIGTIVHRFLATDVDSNIHAFKMSQLSHPGLLRIDEGSGDLIVAGRIDYEDLIDNLNKDDLNVHSSPELSFKLTVLDSGVPQKSARAHVLVKVKNVNDETPRFTLDGIYIASIPEHAAVGTEVITVMAEDEDVGNFGRVSYSLSGEMSEAFTIDSNSGVITTSELSETLLDREKSDFIVLQVTATDNLAVDEEIDGVDGHHLSTSATLNITLSDINDHTPSFVQSSYTVTIVDNIPVYPEASPIAQLSALDLDTSDELLFLLTSGNEDGLFRLDEKTGVLYPNTSLVGRKEQHFELMAVVMDKTGKSDTASIDIDVTRVNTHKPEWLLQSNEEPTAPLVISVPEERPDLTDNVVVLKVSARDRDLDEENGRISYFIKSNQSNVKEITHFSMDENTGELRSKGVFDRESKSHHDLVIVATDHGRPVAFETLRFVTVVVEDTDDNEPTFDTDQMRFSVAEEQEAGQLVGRVEAHDPDDGVNGRVFYYIVSGNDDKLFSVDKTRGDVYTTDTKIDRESMEEKSVTLILKASNSPDHACRPLEGSETSKNSKNNCDIVVPEVLDKSFVRVEIDVEDVDDNLPTFAFDHFYVGVPVNARIGHRVLDAHAFDPDQRLSTSLHYALRSSQLFKTGSTMSSGSLVPSPFTMDAETGRIVLASLLAEFDQDKFVLDVEARSMADSNSNRARTRVHLWVVRSEQLVKVVVAQPPNAARLLIPDIMGELQNATKTSSQKVGLDDVRFHVNNDGSITRSMTDILVHVVDEESNSILEPQTLLRAVDEEADHLEALRRVGVHTIEMNHPVHEEHVHTDHDEHLTLVVLLVLLLLLLLAIICVCILCCGMNNWRAKSVAQSTEYLWHPVLIGKKEKMGNTNDDKIGLGTGSEYVYNPSVLESQTNDIVGNATDNPLWEEPSFPVYEEQELTMTVFTDQDNTTIDESGDGGQILSASTHGVTTFESANPYATIGKMGTMRNTNQYYATLEKQTRKPAGPLVPGIHSQASQSSATLARRRMGQHLGGSSISINRHGEPELVAHIN